MKKRKKKIEIELPQKFNPGTMKYEPALPARKTDRKMKVKIDWKFIIILIILVSALLGTLFIILRKYLPYPF